jgi:filamentous hemagglutinin family protein
MLLGSKNCRIVLGVVTTLAASSGMLAKPVSAQIVPDASLGTNPSVVTPTTIQGIPIQQIDGGAVRGSNLFHSFQEFNINEGQRAYFSNPVGIENILSRVTGSNPSDISGTLGVLGNANLFFINPNGIVFGSNASLDVGGSFVASTANAVQFGDSGVFSATEPTNVPLLTIKPSALLFNQIEAKPINSQAGLGVTNGQSLLLVGGNINLNNGVLYAPGGEVGLVSLTGSGNVGLNFNGNSLSLGLPSGARSDISLNNSEINASNLFGGKIEIFARNLDVFDSNISNATLVGDSSGILLDATGRISLDGQNGSTLIVSGTSGSGNSGDITINTGKLTVTNEAQVFSGTLGSGDGGDITVNAGELTVQNGAQIFSDTEGSGKGGDIAISTEQLTLQNGGQVSYFTSGSGDGGDIAINAGKLTIQNGAVVYSETSGSGNGGKLELKANTVNISNSSFLASLIKENATGKAGDLTIQKREATATGTVTIQDDAAIVAATKSSQVGGNINISTDKLVVQNEGKVLSKTEGLGNSGNLEVTADEVKIIGLANSPENLTSLSTQTPENSEGNAGNLIISSRLLSINNGGQLFSVSQNTGNSGNVTIKTDKVELSGISLLDSYVGENGILNNNLASNLYSISSQGNAGNVDIFTRQLIIQDGAQVTSGSFGEGNGGNLTVSADSIQIMGASPDGNFYSLLGSKALGDTIENPGNIKINTRELIVTDGGQISTSSNRSNRSGNITIDADSIQVIGISPDGRSVSSLSTDAGFSSIDLAKAGDLTINTRELKIQDGGKLSAVTFGEGDGGNLTVNADTIQLSGFGSGISTQAADIDSTGNAGNLTINTRELRMKDAVNISSGTFGEGDGGNLQVTADTIDITGTQGPFLTGLSTSAGRDSTGNAGNLTINTRELRLKDVAQISSGTFGEGDGGNLQVTADTIDITGTQGPFVTGLITSAGRDLTGNAGDLTGNAGDLTISAKQINIRAEGEISTDSVGTGNAGNLYLQADSLSLDNSIISAFTLSGEGGNIDITVNDLFVLNNNSLISTTAGGTGNGGNIEIDARFLIPVNDSDIVSNAFQGNGGDIQITTQGIFASPDSEITASSELGIDGSIELNTPDADPSRGTTNLPTEIVDASNRIVQNCDRPRQVANQPDKSSEFIITGRGGLPPKLGETVSEDGALVGLVSPVNASSNPDLSATPTVKTQSQEVVEAQGWVVNSQGEVFLTAQIPGAGGGSVSALGCH